MQAKVIDAFTKAMADKDFIAFAEKAGFELRSMDAAQMQDFVAKENTEWRQVMGELGLAK